MCAQHDNVKIKCTNRYLDQKSLDHIMHGGSPKKTKNWQRYQLKGLKTMHTSGRSDYLICTNLKMTYHDTNWSWIPIESSWSGEHLVHQGELMYEHIVYELRYGNLSSIEHGSLCMKAHYFI